MDRKKVESSNIVSVGYDPATSTLQIEFRDGAVFDYLDVPQEDYDALMAAESIGKAFYSGIRGVYPSRRVGADD